MGLRRSVAAELGVQHAVRRRVGHKGYSERSGTTFRVRPNFCSLQSRKPESSPAVSRWLLVASYLIELARGESPVTFWTMVGAARFGSPFFVLAKGLWLPNTPK